MKPGISAIVVAYNESALLTKCLTSLKWVTEIIVLDIGSTEDIKSIAKDFHAKYHKLPHVEVVEEIRQKSLEYASFEYVMFVDTDETVPASLAKIIQKEIAESQPAYIKIPRQNIVFGKWIEFSQWWPDYQFRVFQKSKVTWPNVLHAQPTIDGEGLELEPTPENAIQHNNYSSIDQWMEKNTRYAKREAQEIHKSGKSFTLLNVIEKSISQITSRFFQNKGYKDGMHGLVLSLLQSFYYFLVYAYYWECKKYGDLEEESTIYHFPHTWFRHGFAETLFWDNEQSSGIKKIKAKLVRKMIA